MNKYLIVLSFCVGLSVFSCREASITSFERNQPNDPQNINFELPPPVSFNVNPHSSGGLVLSWEDTTGYIDGFEIIRLADDYNETKSYTLSSDVSSLIDSTVSPTRESTYKISSFVLNKDSLNRAEWITKTVDFGTLIKRGMNVDTAKSTLTINWAYEYNWDYITRIHLTFGEDSTKFYSLENMETTLEIPFEPSFEYIRIDVYAYINASDTVNNQTIGSINHIYEQSMEFNPEFYSARIISYNEIELKWRDNSYFEEGFRIYKTYNVSSDEWELIATLPPNTTHYSDTDNPFDDAPIGTFSNYISINYGISAFKGTSSSGDFGKSVAIELESTPTLYAGNLTNTGIEVRWSNNNSSSYTLQRSINGNAFTDYQTLGENTTSYYDTNIVPNNSYSYRIKSEYSRYSNEKTFIYSNYLKENRSINLNHHLNASFRFSNDGNYLVYSGKNTQNESKYDMVVYDLSSNAEIFKYTFPSDDISISNVDIDTNNQYVAYAANTENQFGIIDYSDGTVVVTKKTEALTYGVYDLEFSPDGKYLYTNTWGSEVRKYDIQNDEYAFITRAVSSTTGSYRGIAVHPGGNMIGVNADGNVEIMDSLGSFLSVNTWDLGSVSNYVSFSGSGNSMSYISHFTRGIVYDVPSFEPILSIRTELINVTYDDSYALSYDDDNILILNRLSTIDYHEATFLPIIDISDLRCSPTENLCAAYQPSMSRIMFYSVSDDEKWMEGERYTE